MSDRAEKLDSSDTVVSSPDEEEEVRGDSKISIADVEGYGRGDSKISGRGEIFSCEDGGVSRMISRSVGRGDWNSIRRLLGLRLLAERLPFVGGAHRR